jgi:hypothetical protein
MSQSRRQSLAESISNILVGYFLALGVQLVIFPLYGMKAHISANLQIGAIFTAVSLVRSYLLRRVFNAYQKPRLPGAGRQWAGKPGGPCSVGKESHREPLDAQGTRHTPALGPFGRGRGPYWFSGM